MAYYVYSFHPLPKKSTKTPERSPALAIADLMSYWRVAQESRSSPYEWLAKNEPKQQAYGLNCLIRQYTFVSDIADLSALTWRPTNANELEARFKHLAAQWYRETGTLSFIRQKAMHPAYQRIIGMGKQALPLIFKELENYRGDWLWALVAITGEDPAHGITNFKLAVDAWLNWAGSHGYVAK